MNLRLKFAAAALAAAAIAGSAAMVAGPVHAAVPAAVADAAPMPSLAPMVKRVSPAVVNIATRGTIKEKPGQRNPLMDDPFFRRFFDAPPDSKPRERQFQSAGSGVIVDAKNGYIITNYHVVENASEITITLLDNRSPSPPKSSAATKARISPCCRPSSRIWSPWRSGDSTQLEVGDYVVAIGNPFGLQHTVTAGIVSALGRTGINPDGYEDFIQTDASINPGNSGGALVNLRGELVGINSAILSRSGGNIGIGFAIPVNMVKGVMDQLIKYGQVKRGVLGVNIYDVTPDIAKEFGLTESSGALVAGVAQGSAAEHAGVKTGDIITSINGATMKDAGGAAQCHRHAARRRQGRDRPAARRQAAQGHRPDRRAQRTRDGQRRGHQPRAWKAPSSAMRPMAAASGEDRPGRQPGGAEWIARQRSDRRRRPHAGHEHQDFQRSGQGRQCPGAQRAARLRPPY